MTWISGELLLRQGAVFRMMHQFKDEGEKYRYFIVLNIDPQSDKLIILTTTTTQYLRRQQAHGKDAESVLVGIHPSEYPDIERFCVVDCRSCRSYEKEDLIKNMEKQGVIFKNPLPDSILSRITSSISRDKTLPASIKRLIVKEERE